MMRGIETSPIAASPTQLEVSNWEEALDIHKAEVNLVVIRSQLNVLATQQAAQIVQQVAQDKMLFQTLDKPRSGERSGKKQYPLVTLTGAKELSENLNQTLTEFRRIDPGRSLKVELAVIFKRACWLFHTDKVRLRLIQTLHGEGTEWLPEAYLNRQGLGKGDNERIVTNWSEVRVIRSPNIGLLKGDSYPGNSGRGLAHRSPTNLLTHLNGRLVLKIDSL